MARKSGPQDSREAVVKRYTVTKELRTTVEKLVRDRMDLGLHKHHLGLN